MVDALDLVTADPRRATRLALEARRSARRAADPGAESTAERALGLAARELSDAPAALRHLHRARRVAARAGLAERAAEARMSLALVLAEAGRPRAALREIDAAVPVLSGLPGARLAMQRALILDRLSRFDEAMAGYTTAVAAFRRAGDRLWQARALTNRGVLHAYRGGLRAAEDDLVAAETIYAELGQDLAVAQVRHNRGFVAARAGDVPGALRWYDLAGEYFARTGPSAVALMDRGELLLRARLFPEARTVAEAAVAAARDSRMRLFEAQARLLLAEVALDTGDTATARTQAETARRSFHRQDRPAWAALARYAALRATAPGIVGSRAAAPGDAGTGVAPPAVTRAVAARARAVAADLAAVGWPAPALDARLYAATITPDRAAAAGELRLVRADGRRGPAEFRARAWHAEALLRDAAGDAAGARRAVRAGMDVLDSYRAALGATELRALASSYAGDLAATGLRLALRSGRARSVLWWSERGRAAALRLPEPAPAGRPELAADLADLRRVSAEAGLPGARGGALLREQRVIEERIRRRSWHTPGTAAARPISLERLPSVLGDRTLVEIFDCEGLLHAVIVSAAGARLRTLGPAGEVTAELDALRFALHRLVRRHGTAASLAAASAAARLAAGRLDDALFGPIRDRLAPGPLVLVPAGALHATPWALLATCHGRPVTVAPSASIWLTAATSSRSTATRRVLVAGPGLPHAEHEVHRLAELLTPDTLLTGRSATAEAVLRAMDGAALLHIAAHGRFRADNPMFSALRLADGPLTVYDLERLARPPATVILSACDSGLSAVHPGEELMGLAAALLRRGTRAVLGSVLPVADRPSLDLMLGLHRRLPATPLATALAAAQTAAMPSDLDDRAATAAAFTCFGAA
ncbi:tetratricopeptide (TPR) repeat protein [Catenuloplanes nepalensis]|uniref:Tetratricopeptide (TPR) repeat protein n=1 Tax=Catenuloplanes nepalensis TaxID=587533 RepID=A0ABT9MUL1_9ACTN|nr:CHAT domain-containing protein [Catenuloplanes nepalensis]MDP9795142.1 tetratricopeptide (TPR) repeat protein [Catenuloplanes nepalensis]